MNDCKGIADFIRTGYSEHGIEIAAEGERSLTVKLPADVHLTPLIADLWNEFDAPVDLRNGPGNQPVLTVWASVSDRRCMQPTPAASASPDSNTLLCGGVGLAVVCSVAINWVFLAVLSTNSSFASVLSTLHSNGTA